MSDSRSQLPGYEGPDSGQHGERLARLDDKQPHMVRYPNPQPPRGPVAEPDDFQSLIDLLQMFRRHKWALAVSLALGGIAALGISVYTVPTYRAQATMQIESVQEPFAGVFAGQDPTFVTESQLLASKAVRDRTAAKVSSLGPAKPQRFAGPLTRLRGLLRLEEPSSSIAWNDAVGMAAGSLKILTTRESRILAIQADSANPQAAADFVNTLAEEYIQRNQEQRWEAYQNTGEWLNKAQEELKAKLEQSEQQLAAFAKSAGLLFTSDTQNISEEKLKGLQSELAQAAANRIAKYSVYESSLSSPTESLPEVLDSGPMAQYQVKIADLRREYAEASVALTPEHPKVKRLQAQINELETAKEKERTNIIKRIRIDYEAAQRREKQLEKDFVTQSGVVSDEAQRLITYSTLKREVDTNRDLYKTTLQKGKEASLASAMRTNNARVVDRARVPMMPQEPNVPLNLALGSFGGLFCGAVFVFVRARADIKIHSPYMLGNQLSLRELGVIPSAKLDPEVRALTRQSRGSTPLKAFSEPGLVGKTLLKSSQKKVKTTESLELVTWTRSRSIIAEAFRATMTSILFSNQNGSRPRVLLVTSPSPQEGKSTVVANLGIALAEIGQRVLLIDGDMRLPRLHTIFDVANTFGLSDILSERTPIGDYSDEMLVRKSSMPGLHVLPAGPARSDLARLLYSPRMNDVIERFRLSFDIVLIDSAPVLSVPDSRILARSADGVVLVVRAHKTASTAAAAAASRFEEDGRPILGTILNDWNPHRSGDEAASSYYNPYSSYYRTENRT